MKLNSRIVWVCLIAGVFILFGGFRLANYLAVPAFNVKPVSSNSAMLGVVEVEKILNVEHFRVYRRLRQVPPAVRQSFSNVTGFPFDLEDPDDIISTDANIPGKSHRRLILLALGRDSSLLIYEEGGFAGLCYAFVFWHRDSGGWWAARVDSFPTSLDNFKKAFHDRKFIECKLKGN